jgi:type IV pilus assembly protein PilW
MKIAPGVIKRNQQGFSLIDVMVGMVIGLIGIIIVFQTFAVSEGYKRTTTSGADAQQNGALALFYLERDLRMAGYGINTDALLGCKVLAYDELPPTREFSFIMVPVVIGDGVGGAPDSITITMGNSDILPMPTEIIQTMPSPTAVFKVASRFGFRPGDLLIAAEQGKDCTLAQATGLPGTPGQGDNVIHNSGNYQDINGGTVPARYNKPAGLGVSYSAYDYTNQTGGKLFNIGPLPVNTVYSVQNAQLTFASIIQGTGSATLTENIVQLQAEYGKDAIGNDGIVDLWEATMPPAPTADHWKSIIAVRLAIVARSGLREKPNPVTGLCDTTVAAPVWAGGAIDLTADPDWQCYRYRTFETTVPLRNLIWKPES